MPYVRNVRSGRRRPEVVKFYPLIRCPQCGYDSFEPLGEDDETDKLRCMRCGGVFTRRDLGVDIVNLDSERRKREMQNK